MYPCFVGVFAVGRIMTRPSFCIPVFPSAVLPKILVSARGRGSGGRGGRVTQYNSECRKVAYVIACFTSRQGWTGSRRAAWWDAGFPTTLLVVVRMYAYTAAAVVRKVNGMAECRARVLFGVAGFVNGSMK